MSGPIIRKEGNSKRRYIGISVAFIAIASLVTLFGELSMKEYWNEWGVGSVDYVSILFLVILAWISVSLLSRFR